MSLATLKRKSNTTYRKLSGKSPKDRFIINKNSAGNPGFMVRKDCIDYKDPSQQSIHGAPNYNSITGTGGGFSINGKHRNIGRVGQSMRMSKGLGRMKTVSSSGCKMKEYSLVNSQGEILKKKVVCKKTKAKNYPVWKGYGGKIGKYGRGTQLAIKGSTVIQPGSKQASGKYGTACCSDSSKLVKPSVLSFKGMMSARNKWVKLNIPESVWTDANITTNNRPPYSDSVKASYNNWVQMLGGNGNVQTKTQGQYIIDNVKPSAQICNIPLVSDVPTNGQKLINTYNCKSCHSQNDSSNEDNLQTILQRGQCNKCYTRIGGKYKPPTPFTKSTTFVPSSSVAQSYNKRLRATLPTQGWQASWPPTVTDAYCSKPYSSILSSNDPKEDLTLLKAKAKEDKLVTGTNPVIKGFCAPEFYQRYTFIQFQKRCGGNKDLNSYIKKYNIPKSYF